MIPFTLTQTVLKRYYDDETGGINENSFVYLMKNLNSTNISNIPSHVDLFMKYDVYKNNYITREDLLTKLFEENRSTVTRMKIRNVMNRLKVKPFSELNFLDFHKIMNEVFFSGKQVYILNIYI